MPRLSPSKTCPKCKGPMKKEPSTIGPSIYVCENCDPADPFEIASKWMNSELKPPT